MDKKEAEKIIKEYLDHVSRFSWQYGVTTRDKIKRFLEFKFKSNANTKTNCGYPISENLKF